jgi:TRAP-type C4-dicarboxylate transport system permease small subunit
MSHGLAVPSHQSGPVPPALAPLARALALVNRAVLAVSMLALVAAAAVLTYSVLTRYFFKSATDWQDEAAVFLLVGATFLCGAYVQSYRGHIGIEAIAGLLPARIDRLRRVLVDLLTTLFCAFFTWKSWTLFHEALVEKQTSSSSWAPPLAIPYGLMAAGMTLLTVQVLLQLAAELMVARSRR